MVDDDTRELNPVLRSEVDAFPFEDPVDRFTEIIRIHDGYEVTDLIDSIRLVERAKPIEFVGRYVQRVVDPVACDLDGVRVQEGSKLAPQVRRAPVVTPARVKRGVQKPVKQRSAEAPGLFVDRPLGRLDEDVGRPDFVGSVLGMAGAERQVAVPRRFRRPERDQKTSPRFGSAFDEANGPSSLGGGGVRRAGGGLQIAVDT